MTHTVGRRLSMPLWYTIAAIVGSVLLLAVAGVAYTNYALRQSAASEREADRRNDARWCALLVPLDNAYTATPPQTQTGKDVAAAIHRLRQQHGC